MRSASELARRRTVRRRGLALLTLACYLLMTIGCAAGIVVGVWHGLLTLSLLGCALGVYYASELRVLVVWSGAARMSASGSAGSNGIAWFGRPNVSQNQPYSTLARRFTRPSRLVPDGVMTRRRSASSRPSSFHSTASRCRSSHDRALHRIGIL